MPDDIRATFVSIAEERLGDGERDGDGYVRQMEAAGKYQLECWS